MILLAFSLTKPGDRGKPNIYLLTKKMMKYVKRNFANFVLNIQSFFPLLGRVAASLPFYFFGFFLFGLFTRCICMIVCRYIWEITR